MDDGINETTEVDTDRAHAVQTLTKAIARVGWDLRFQEPAVNLAEKLCTAIDQDQAEEDAAAPTAG
jgi:hypothetical protein